VYCVSCKAVCAARDTVVSRVRIEMQYATHIKAGPILGGGRAEWSPRAQR
jgi:hypothetical protein